MNEFVAAQRQALLEITLQSGRIPSAEQSEFLNFQTWIRLLQIQAADQAKIDAQPSQLIATIKKNPLFQKDQAYDPEIFQRFNANFLAPQGFSGERFNQAVLDSVRTDTLLRALASTAFVVPEEAEKKLQQLFGAVHAQVVRWDPSKTTPPEPKSEDLESFYKEGTLLAAHPPCSGELKAIPCGTGSLGHGLSLACGLVFSQRFTGKNFQVYAILSDGDCNEGSTWEAVLFAAHHQLVNLTVIVDLNVIQGIG